MAISRMIAGTLPRSHLSHLLTRDAEARLVIVAAPAGYGKTTTVRLAVERACKAKPDTAVPWITVSPHCNTPGRLYAVILSALREALGEIRDHDNADLTVKGLSATLARIKRDIIIVIDDLHLVSPGVEGVDDLLSEMVDTLPQNVRTVLVSRLQPEMPCIKRLRIRREIIEVGTEDLRMSPEEVLDLLKLTYADDQIDFDIACALAQRTEGWIMGVVIAEDLRRRTGRSWHEHLPKLHGEVEGLASYFAQEVFLGLSEKDRHLVRILAELPEWDLHTLAHLGEDADRAAFRGTEWNALIALAGKEHATFRMHPLFAEFIRAHETLSPHDYAQLASIAVGAGRTGAALNLLARAGQWEEYVDILRPMLFGGDGSGDPARLTDVEKHLQTVPPNVRERLPHWWVAWASVLQREGRFKELAVLESPGCFAAEHADAVVHITTCRMRAHTVLGNPAEAVRLGAPHATRMQAAGLCTGSDATLMSEYLFALHQLGDPCAAPLLETFAQWLNPQSDNPHERLLSLYHLIAHTAPSDRDLPRLLNRLDALVETASHIGHHAVIAAEITCGNALATLELFDAALQHYERAQEGIDRSGHTHAGSEMLYNRARALTAVGRLEEARRAIVAFGVDIVRRGPTEEKFMQLLLGDVILRDPSAGGAPGVFDNLHRLTNDALDLTSFQTLCALAYAGRDVRRLELLEEQAKVIGAFWNGPKGALRYPLEVVRAALLPDPSSKPGEYVKEYATYVHDDIQHGDTPTQAELTLCFLGLMTLGSTAMPLLSCFECSRVTLAALMLRYWEECGEDLKTEALRTLATRMDVNEILHFFALALEREPAIFLRAGLTWIPLKLAACTQVPESLLSRALKSAADHRVDTHAEQIFRTREPAPFSYRCLGDLVITRGGAPIELPADGKSKILSFLGYMIVNAGRDVHVEHVLDAVFGEVRPGNATNYLYQIVRRARLLLEPWLPSPRSSHIILAEQNAATYRFIVREQDTLDIRLFQASIDHMKRGADIHSMEASASAIAQYRGEFLANVRDEGWAAPWRERFGALMIDALRQQTKWHVRMRDWEHVRQVAERGYTLAPHEEEFCVALLHLAVNARDLRAFERTYASHVAAKEEFDGQPPGTFLQNLRASLLRRF